GLGGGKGRQQSRATHDGGHDGIDFGCACHLNERIGTAEYFRLETFCRNRGAQTRRRLLVQQYRIARLELATLLEEQRVLVLGSEREDLVAFAVFGYHTQRIDADGTGGAQDGERL